LTNNKEKRFSIKFSKLLYLFIVTTPFTVSLWQFYLLIILRLKKIFIFNNSDIYFMIFIIPYLYYKYTLFGLYVYEYIRIYFAFFLFYLIFRHININFNILSKILIVIHVLEIIAITFNVEPLGLFNIQGVNTGFILFGEDFRRPVGIFTNATMSASAYVVILSLTTNKLVRWFMILTIVTYFSGTAIIALFIYFISKNFSLTKLLVGLLLFIVLSLKSSLNKISVNNIIFNVELKIRIFFDIINNMEMHELLFGSNEQHYLADFGFSLFLSSYGVYGIIVILAFVVSKMNKDNNITILISLFVSFAHYPFTALALGALLLGVILSRNKESLAVSYYQITPRIFNKYHRDYSNNV
jgi:hypothetical protein